MAVVSLTGPVFSEKVQRRGLVEVVVQLEPMWPVTRIRNDVDSQCSAAQRVEP